MNNKHTHVASTQIKKQNITSTPEAPLSQDLNWMWASLWIPHHYINTFILYGRLSYFALYDDNHIPVLLKFFH